MIKIEEQKEIEKLIAQSQRILITTRGNPGFDDCASGLAWYHWLSTLGKARVDIAIDLEARTRNRFKFLPGFDQIIPSIQSAERFVIQVDVSKTKVRELSYDKKDDVLEIHIQPVDGHFSPDDVSFAESSFSYELIIAVGSPELASSGSIFAANRQLFFNTPIINIDRSSANARYGQINAIYLTATSLAEISYPFMRNALSKDMANCLLTGLMAATNSFQTPQVTPDTLQLAGELIVAGAERAEIVDRLYRNKDLAKLKLWGRVLSHLQQSNGVIVYSHLTREEIGSGEIDLDGLVDELVMASPEAHLVLFFYEESHSTTRVFVYARENYDLPVLFQQYQPQGKRRHIQFTVPKDTVQTEIDVLQRVREQLRMIGQ